MVAFTSTLYIALIALLLWAMIGFIVGAILTKGDPVGSLFAFLVFGFLGTAGFPIIFGITKSFIAMLVGG